MEGRCIRKETLVRMYDTNGGSVYSTSILAIQPLLNEIIQLQNERARARKQRRIARHIFQIRPNNPVSARRLRSRRAPD